MTSAPTASQETPEERDPNTDDRHVVVMGAGPAGLTAAWQLTRNDVTVDVLEADPEIVGGIARTASYKGFRFDIGGHRFFTKADEVRVVWHEILDRDDDWLTVPRLSRIFYNGKFFQYPLRAFEALRKLGIITSALCLLSYAKAKVLPRKPERSFEDWVVNRFGYRLYSIFFKTYTEKVWGMPCSEISADWAAQRIKGLSLLEAVKNAVQASRGGPQKAKKDGEVIKTLIEEFEYPKYGPGMMWERATEKVRARGNPVRMGERVVTVRHDGERVTEVVVDTNDGQRTYGGTDFLSTLPIRELANIIEPAPPQEVLEAANALRYRDFLTVVLVVDRAELFPDNWIYIHDPTVHLGRVQNFKNWSPFMVPDTSQSALGLEYFCTEGDTLWDMGDEDLRALGAREIEQIGLARAEDIIDGTTVRMRKAYPVYDDDYKENVATVWNWISDNLSNLQLVGRNGMHKYNNQDHSMMTAMLAARNILGESWDPWNVNTDAEYHEEEREDHDTAGRMIPQRLT
ncbi:MAG TPA: NAD(P)/FAD-dependent oxidoreductase [Egibacteraceae bacterium]|nr:NAD(P)/FAD-dependent oxidoreductase [Egibacteraceae bacterium]